MPNLVTKNIAQWFPERTNGRDVNKGSFGHAFVFAGSEEMTGAPVMVAEAAARSGAGLVTLALPENLKQIVMDRVSPVIMSVGLPQNFEGTYWSVDLEYALTLVEKATAVVIGPGIGLGIEVANFIRGFILRCPVPLVIDADALTLLSRESDRGEFLVRSRNAATILTPHPAEMARLLGITTPAVQADRSHAALIAARNYGAVVLLKGAQTLIADAEGSIYQNPSGNPGMATGGSGDVLSGVLVALLAQKLEAFYAAVVGAYIHGVAGDLAAVEIGGMTGMIATDLIAHLPKAIAQSQRE